MDATPPAAERRMIMGLIDIDKFEVDVPISSSFEFVSGVLHVLNTLDAVPTVDAVKVVRCKDCIYSYEEFGFIHCTFGPYGDCKVPSQFYCAEGKRKENE